MKDTIKIGTINLQNNKINRKGGLREDGTDASRLVAQHIEEQQFDILGTQELTRNFTNNIASKLVKNRLYGNYRYGNSLLTRIPFINAFNENNNIITSNEVIEEKTKLLPFMPTNIFDLKKILFKTSIMSRIVTTIVMKDKNGNILCAINTHLDYEIPSIQIRQLNFLKGIIEQYSKKYPIVLTGDFNMEIGTEHFDKFNRELNELGLKRVEVNEKTNADKFPNQTAIDHIFIPKNWDIVNKGINEIKDVTDHREVYVEVRIK